jgi:hypothetical protein
MRGGPNSMLRQVSPKCEPPEMRDRAPYPLVGHSEVKQR